MPQLIKKIEASIVEDLTGPVILVKSFIGEVQEEDYINLGGLVAYLQDFTKSDFTSALIKPLLYGLPNTYNLPVTTLNIDY